jgi:hypothetical protein
VLVELERDNPVLPIRVTRIIVSTQPAGAASPCAKFSTALFTALDAKGDPLDTIYGVLGYSKRFHLWHMIAYGSSDCVVPALIVYAVIDLRSSPDHPAWRRCRGLHSTRGRGAVRREVRGDELS